MHSEHNSMQPDSGKSLLTCGRYLCPWAPWECLGGSMGGFVCGVALCCFSPAESDDVSPLAQLWWWLLGECICLVVRGDLGGIKSWWWCENAGINLLGCIKRDWALWEPYEVCCSCTCMLDRNVTFWPKAGEMGVGKTGVGEQLWNPVILLENRTWSYL